MKFPLLIISRVAFNIVVGAIVAYAPRFGHTRDLVFNRSSLPPRALARLGDPSNERWPDLVSAVLSPSGKTLATVGFSQPLYVWDLASGKVVRSILINHTDSSGGMWACGSMYFSADGQTIIAASDPETICFWNVDSGKELKRLRLVPDTRVASFALSPDQKTLAALLWGNKEKGGGFYWYDVESGKQYGTVSEHSFSGIALSPDGTTLATPFHDKEVCLWSLRDRKEKYRFKGHGTRIRSLAFSPDGKLLASASGKSPSETVAFDVGSDHQDETVKWWSVATGRLAGVLKAHRLVDDFVTFSPDGRLFAAVGEGSVLLWEAATGKILFDLIDEHSAPTSVDISRDGATVASAMSDGTALIWSLAPDGWKAPKDALSEKQCLASWSDLASADASIGYRAVWTLSSRAESIDFLKNRMGPITAIEKDSLRQLIADLDNDDFARREAANKELSHASDQAEPLLREALEQTESPEARKRLKALLKGRESWLIQDADLLQAVRAIWVLQRIGTPEAKALLEKLAAGAPTARQTQEAQAALEFLKRSKGR